jgi:hypothetical protein
MFINHRINESKQARTYRRRLLDSERFISQQERKIGKILTPQKGGRPKKQKN